VLGRGAAATLRLDDPSLSRNHARIRIDGSRVLLQDLGSRNGLWVKGRRTSDVQEIHPGDEVRAGRTVLALGVAASPTPPISPLPPEREERPDRRRMARVALVTAVAAAAAAAALAPW
jgi:pSer/pThr/pTyr-binding forkhead associated (FHA) protein